MSNTGVNFRKPKVSSAYSNFSKKSDKTTKSYKPIRKNDFNIEQNNPAYIYYKEILRSQEYLRKRNQTAKLNNKRIFLQNAINNLQKISKFDNNSNYNNFKKSQTKKVNQTHRQIINQYKDPKNPYSTFWPNHILDTRFKMELGIKGFVNGIPILNIKKKKINYKVNSKENKNLNNKIDIKKNDIYNNNLKDKNNNTFNKGDNNDFNIKNNDNNSNNNPNNKKENEDDYFEDDKMDKLFNTNQKDFFKFRKDIKEEPENEEEDDSKKEEEINGENEEKKNIVKNIQSKSEINTKRDNDENIPKKDIQFKEIFKYFKFKKN
jgi:hypothetical protein